MDQIRVTGPMLQELREARNESYQEFGISLGKACLPPKEFSKPYIINVISGRKAVTPELEKAYWALGATLDGLSLEAAQLKTQTIFSIFELPEKIKVSIQPRKCKNPICEWWFLGGSNFQQYCSPECRQSWHQKIKDAHNGKTLRDESN